jgi:signal transduction histidine kinase
MTARILLVDDDSAGRYFKTHVLRKAGHEVVEAASGREALDAVAAQLIDIVLLDVKLPDLSGIEVCRRVKAAHPDILVLQTSAAFTASHHRAAGLGGGADSYLAEPVEAEELTASIEALLRLRRAERDLRALNETLEHRVAERTRDLAEAHRRLQEETTERLIAEEALRQSQKMEAVGRLTGGVAHDFNNLLTVISANLELLEQAMERPPPLDKEKALKMVRAAQRAAGRGEKLTQQLLAFGRRQVLRLEVVDLNALVGGFESFLRQVAGEAIQVERKLVPELWAVRIDPTQFEAALLNLAVNARDAMPSGGTLCIETRNLELAVAERDLPAGSYVVFEVSDTGTGMSEETRERAFEPFYTTKDVGKGSGLGLSQVYGFVQQAGGDIRIESVEGEGTTFRLFLPRFAGEQKAARTDAADEAAASRGTP